MTQKPKKKAEKGGFHPRLAGASMIVLTGPSGSGKSSLASYLERQGWQRLDGDVLARGLYVPGSALMKKMLQVFGRGILQADGSLNRVHLGEIVFPSLAQRRRLNALVYPLFLRTVKKAMKLARQRRQCLVADLAVYFDAGAPDLGAPVVIVDAPLGLRVQRLRQRGLSASRAKAQASALKFTRPHRAQAALVLDGRAPKAALQRLLSRHLRATSS